MTPQGGRRTRIIVGTVVVVLVGYLLGGRVLDARERGAIDDAVRAAATTYADLVATGTGADLERLWSMTVSSDPGPLRTAGELLARAGERIEVVEVGDPQAAERPALRGLEGLDHFRGVEVRYRLDGTESRFVVVLGRLVGRSGTDVDDWRVARTMTGALGWTVWDPTTTFSDFYVNGLLHVASPVRVGSDEVPEQPLYAALYKVELRRDPWYASPVDEIPVRAGASPPLAPLQMQATEATTREIGEQVAAQLDLCGTDEAFRCPASTLLERAGVDVQGEPGRWGGLVRPPTLTFEGFDVTLSDGVIRFRAPGGVRRMRIDGSGRVGLSNNDGRPFVTGLTIEEARP